MHLTRDQVEKADDGLHGASIIAKLLQKLGTAEIHNDEAIEGGTLRWLAERLDEALVAIRPMIEASPS